MYMANVHQDHLLKVTRIQEQMRQLHGQKQPSCVSLEHSSTHTNTTRSRSYKNSCPKLDLSELNQIIQIDPEKRIAIVEPRVTMEKLVRATLAKGLIPAVVPEFKAITVGGAIMGGAGESSSHKWGSFNDTCLSLEILCGDGSVIVATPTENSDVFYAVPCSYGSLGVLLSATIRLLPAKELIRLKYHPCTSAAQAIQKIQELLPASPDFLDGILFSKEKAVVIEGCLADTADQLPYFGLKSQSAEWYYQHVEKLGATQEVMTLSDYLFRYDQGAFWVGGFLLQPKLVLCYLLQGIFKSKIAHRPLTPQEIEKLRAPIRPNLFWRTLLHPILSTKNLWRLFHLADKWAQNHSILQDFCIPQHHTTKFLQEIMDDPGTFPLWLCPIKSTQKPQIFAPHLTAESHVINIGIYGLPSTYTSSTESATKRLEQKAQKYEGKKVLYSRSYYTEEQFWQIYSQQSYRALREKLGAEGTFHDITAKVLSE